MRTSRAFPIERGGPERVTLSWDGAFDDMRVAFDGVECAKLDKKKVKTLGDRALLPDGSTLFVKLRGLLGVEARRDDVALPGSDLDPRRLLRNAGFLLALVAAIDLATDLARWQRGASVTPLLGIEAAMIVFAAAAFFGQRVALGLGIAAIVARVGLLEDRSTASFIFAVIATWLLSTHLFAAWRRPKRAI